jgi:hypothetical protein
MIDVGQLLRKCLLGGHRWRNSKQKPGWLTCERCGARRQAPR